MAQVAGLIADGWDVIVTHGNGPQVGALFSSEGDTETSLDVCVGMTQASIGLMIVAALEAELRSLGVPRPAAAIITRVRVDRDDPAWSVPTKPIGAYFGEGAAAALRSRDVDVVHVPRRGWRRVVASPEPVSIVELAGIEALLDAGVVVVAAGGGGVPVWSLERPAEAVLDKDLTAALLARLLGASLLIIATEVPQVMVGFGTDDARPLGRVSPDELRALAAEGHFPPGSMGPKVEAAIRFAGTGGTAVITSLDGIRAAASGDAGTAVVAPGPPAAVSPVESAP